MSIQVLNYPVKRATLARDVYKINLRAFTLWLRDIDINHRKTLSPADLKKIIAHYDLPSHVTIKI